MFAFVNIEENTVHPYVFVEIPLGWVLSIISSNIYTFQRSMYTFQQWFIAGSSWPSALWRGSGSKFDFDFWPIWIDRHWWNCQSLSQTRTPRCQWTGNFKEFWEKGEKRNICTMSKNSSKKLWLIHIGHLPTAVNIIFYQVDVLWFDKICLKYPTEVDGKLVQYNVRIKNDFEKIADE